MLTIFSQLLQSDPLIAYSLTGILGLLLGSFLNVVIYRLPLMVQQEYTAASDEAARPDRFNLAWPNSHCPACKQPVSAWQNIPLVSYLLLKGRCHHCRTPIALQYPLVELTAALLALFSLYQFGATPFALALTAVSLVLLALTVIDLQTFLLPDRLTLPLLWAGLLWQSLMQPEQLSAAVWGAALGYLVLWSVYWLFKLATGKEGMGYGDFKLLAALGAWLGAPQLPALLLLSAVSGIVIGLIYKLAHKGHQGGIPFGPALALAGWFCLTFPDTVRHLMNSLFL